MTTGSKLLLTGVAAAALVAVAAWAVDIDVSGDVELPTVVADVNVEGGEMPAVDVDTVDVDVEKKQASMPVPSDMNVETKTVEVEVPADVNVETEDASIPYPSVDVTAPEEDDVAEQNNLEEPLENEINKEDTEADETSYNSYQ